MLTPLEIKNLEMAIDTPLVAVSLLWRINVKVSSKKKPLTDNQF